jgi:hypothetical protein
MRILYEGLAPLFLCDHLIEEGCLIRIVDYGNRIQFEYQDNVWRAGSNFYHTEASYKIVKLLCEELAELQD